MKAFSRPASVYPTLFSVLHQGPLKVSIIGSGNWASAISTIIGVNARESHMFNDSVRMWVFDEIVEGRKLSEWINQDRLNKKYLPDSKLPENIQAFPNLIDACKDADLLVFVLPHQFLEHTCKELNVARVLPPHTRAISLIKGLAVRNGWPETPSSVIHRMLGLPQPCVLSGANVAGDIALGLFAEATLGYDQIESATASIWQCLFDTPNFKINTLPDCSGIEVCGAVKNIIALVGGFCDGMNYGTNTKAALVRIGVEEMKAFSMIFFDGFLADTFFDSAGYADVITTVFGGRNAKCAAAFVRAKGEKTWNDLEVELLNGQKLQGTLTLCEVVEVLKAHDLSHLFPLFMATYDVAFKGENPDKIVDIFRSPELRAIQSADECTILREPATIRNAKSQIKRIRTETSPTTESTNHFQCMKASPFTT